MANLSYINSILDEEGIGVEQNSTPAPTTPTNAFSNDDLVQMVDEEDAPSEYDQRITDRRKAVFSNIRDFAFDSADLAAAMLGGSGISEAVGAGVENPVSAATRGEEIVPIKSLPQDMDEGNYFDATLKTVGLAGDVLQLGGAYTAATGAGIIPGAVMMAGGTALKYGTKAASKYGDEIVDGLRKLFDIDPDAADRAAEVVDKLADQDKPIEAVQGVLNKQIKIAGRKSKASDAPEPVKAERVAAPTRELGLFNRAEEAVANMDIPEEGIRADALMTKLRNDPDVPNDEIDFGVGLMSNPDEMLTREKLDAIFANTFGVKETILKGSDTKYASFTQHRLPDEQGSDYTEIVYQTKPSNKDVDLEPLYVSDEHFEDYANNQIGHMRTSVRRLSDGSPVLYIEEIQSDAFKVDGGADGVGAPFKNKAGFTNMMLARAMRMAAEQGLNGVVVTNAIEQIRRNQQSFDGVYTKAHSDYVPEDIVDRPDGSSMIIPSTHKVELEGPDTVTEMTVDSITGVVITSDTDGLAGQKLSDLLQSKEMADELLNTSSKAEVNFSDRVIGKSGYKAVYDKRIPKRLNNIVSRLDLNEKVEVTKQDIFIDNDNTLSSLDEVKKQIPGIGEEQDVTQVFEGGESMSSPPVFDKAQQAIARYEALPEEEQGLLSEAQVLLAKSFFGDMKENFKKIEAAVGYSLEWEEEEVLNFLDYNNLGHAVSSVGDLAFLKADDIIAITKKQRLLGIRDLQDMISSHFPDMGSRARDLIARIADEDYGAGARDLNRDRKLFLAVKKDAETLLQNVEAQLDEVLDEVFSATPPMTIKDNNAIMFTDEMSERIVNEGLPRLNKGGLVGRK
jgi:hypothetical protein